MKRIKNVLAGLLMIFAAAALMVSAQDTGTPPETSTESVPQKAPVKKAGKPAKKKKKPAPKPVSEYRFNQTDSIPAYKFDKQTNPIIKARPKKKPAKKAAVKKAGAPKAAPKPKKQPPSDDNGQVRQGELPPQPPTGD